MPMESSGSKRGSSEVDDCDECLPISKRINRLHIEAQRHGRSDERQPCAHQQQPLAHQHVSNGPSAWQDGARPQPNSPQAQLYPAACVPVTMTNGAPHPQYATNGPLSAMYQQPMSGGGHAQNPYNAMQTPGAGRVAEYLGQQQFAQPGAEMPGGNPQFLQAPFAQGEAVDSMDYDPELGERENPFYFRINHVLFNAHCRRMRRDGDPVDPGGPGPFP